MGHSRDRGTRPSTTDAVTSRVASSPMVQTDLRSRPFAAESESSASQTPTLQTQISNAHRYGHSLERYSLTPAHPTSIQPQRSIGTSAFQRALSQIRNPHEPSHPRPAENISRTPALHGVAQLKGSGGTQNAVVQGGGVTIEEVDDEPIQQPLPPAVVTQPAIPLAIDYMPWKERQQLEDPRYQQKLQELHRPNASQQAMNANDRRDRQNLLTPHLAKSQQLALKLGKPILESLQREHSAHFPKILQFLDQYSTISDKALQLAFQYLKNCSYTVTPQLISTVDFLISYLPETTQFFPLAVQYLTSLGSVEKAQGCMDFLVKYHKDKGDVALKTAENELAKANYDVQAAELEMAKLKEFNYDPELEQYGETGANQSAQKVFNALMSQATSTQQQAKQVATTTFNQARQVAGTKPSTKQGRKTYTEKENQDKAAKETAFQTAESNFQAAQLQAPIQQQQQHDRFMGEFKGFIGIANTNQISPELIKQILMLPEVAGDGAKAGAVLPIFQQCQDAKLALDLAKWVLLSNTTAQNRPRLIDFVLKMPNPSTPVAQDLALLLTENLTDAQTAIGYNLIQDVLTSPDPNATLKLLQKQKTVLLDANRAFRKTTSEVDIPCIVQVCQQSNLSLTNVAIALEAMFTQNLTTLADFKEVLGLLTRKVPKPTKANKSNQGQIDQQEIEALLALQPTPATISEDLNKRQKDPAKLKTLLGKVRLEITTPTTGATGVDRNRLETLAKQDKELETQELLNIGVSPQLLIDVTAMTELPPKRIAEITEDEAKSGDANAATNLINYAKDRRVPIHKMIEERGQNAKMVRKMQTQNITTAEADDMARFEHNKKDVPGEKSVGKAKYGRARLDHFVKRHTYRHFEFTSTNIDATQTMWAENTKGADVLSKLQSDLPAEPANGGADGTQGHYQVADWSGAKFSVVQYYPLAGTHFSQAVMTRFKDAFSHP